MAERYAADGVEFPGVIPPLAPEAARWAAEQFYRACHFAVYRDAGAERIAAALSPPCPLAPAAARHAAVDLAFRFLPDLFRLAHTASAGDPLCDRLRRWAVDWPLSSVGMADVNPTNVGDLCNHAGLLQRYVDRIIARRARSRLSDPRVRTAVQAAWRRWRRTTSTSLRSFIPTDASRSTTCRKRKRRAKQHSLRA